MLGFSWGELLIVFVVVIVFVDPKDIPSLARNAADLVKKFRSISREFTDILTKEVEEPKKYIKDLNGNMQETYDLSDLKDKK